MRIAVSVSRLAASAGTELLLCRVDVALGAHRWGFPVGRLSAGRGTELPLCRVDTAFDAKRNAIFFIRAHGQRNGHSAGLYRGNHAARERNSA